MRKNADTDSATGREFKGDKQFIRTIMLDIQNIVIFPETFISTFNFHTGNINLPQAPCIQVCRCSLSSRLNSKPGNEQRRNPLSLPYRPCQEAGFPISHLYEQYSCCASNSTCMQINTYIINFSYIAEN